MNSRVNQTVAVVDYGMGNLRSVAQAVLHATQDTHVNAVITADPAQVRAAHRVVLPGQGAMADCMSALRESGLQDAVLEAVTDHPEIKYLLVVGDAISFIDSSGEEMLHNIVTQLQQSGVEVVFSGLKRQVLNVMRATGLYGFIGGELNIYATETQALNAIYLRLGEGENACVIFPPKTAPAE